MNATAKKARELFVAAVKLAPDQWDPYLNKACAGDDELRVRVRNLLSAHLEAGSFLQAPASPDLAALPGEDGKAMKGATIDDTISEQPGTMIGPYKLLEQIGEGGFGVVFMAEQMEPVRRKVALKILKPGMDTRQVVARFEAERQALAIMDHPNIAKVFDGGATGECSGSRQTSGATGTLASSATGRPYFVMELVKGVAITEFCDQNHLTPRQRLELFIPVCHAVQHAHQKGVIHRDLKPSNILVTVHDTTPVPKVIDFGIAKALGQELTDKTLFTGFAQMVGTPLYMSPEQAGQSGLDIDTRSDIYSLGVLLYELLTGTTPFPKERFKQAAYDEIRRIIREEEPPKPSTRLSTLRNAESGMRNGKRIPSSDFRIPNLHELDWIVMKCLEKDRNRRYETANAFVADMQRYLSDEPVLACPPSAWNRFRKFSRRHTRAVAMAGLAATVIVLGMIVLAVANRLITNAWRQEKTAREDLSEALRRERQVAYFRLVARADSEFLAKQFGRVEELLESCPADLRGWEWHCLMAQVRGAPDVLRGHDKEVHCVAFSPPDGRYLVTTGRDEFVKVWDVRSRQPIRNLSAQEGFFGHIVFSPDGQRLAGRGADGKVKGKVRVWDFTDGTVLAELDHADSRAVAFSLQGQTIATADKDFVIRIWDINTGRIVRALAGHAGGIQGLAFSRDGGRLASASNDGTVKLWDTSRGEEIHTFTGYTDGARQVAFRPDGRHLATSDWAGIIRVWDTNTLDQVMSLFGHHGPVHGLTYTPDGQRLASAGYDTTSRFWDATTGEELLTLRGHTDVVLHVDFCPTGWSLASASVDKTVLLWDAAPHASTNDSAAVTLRGHPSFVFAVAFHPDNRRVASVSLDKTARVWDSTTAQALQLLEGHTGSLWGVAFDRSGRRLATGGHDGAVKIWDLESSQPLHTFREKSWIWRVAFSADGRRVAAATRGKTIKVWNADTGAEIAALPHDGDVNAVAFSPDGRWLASGTASKGMSIKVWDVESCEPIHTLLGHESLIHSVAFSHDSKLLASASSDKTVKIWDPAQGVLIRTLEGQQGHTGRVQDVAFGPAGRLASASLDGTVMLWDAATGKRLHVLRGHIGQPYCVAISSDGRRLAVGSGHGGRGAVKIWDLTQIEQSP